MTERLLGRLPKRNDPRTLQLDRYLNDAIVLPTVPPKVDYTKPVSSWPMYGNDRLGDCTCAAAGHMVEAWTAAAGRPQVPADGDVELMYWKTGTPPSTTGTAGGPTDTGRVELDVLNQWRNVGLGQDKISAYVEIDPQNVAHVKAGIYLFGGVYVGVALPISAQSQKEWRVAAGPNGQPGSWGGHAIPFHGYDSKTVTLVTWGFVMKATWGFHRRYVDEVYAILSPDWLNSSGRSLAGFNASQLQADLAAL